MYSSSFTRKSLTFPFMSMLQQRTEESPAFDRAALQWASFPTGRLSRLNGQVGWMRIAGHYDHTSTPDHNTRQHDRSVDRLIVGSAVDPTIAEIGSWVRWQPLPGYRCLASRSAPPNSQRSLYLTTRPSCMCVVTITGINTVQRTNSTRNTLLKKCGFRMAS